MKPIKKKDGWWIRTDDEEDDMGPYQTKKEALEGIDRLKAAEIDAETGYYSKEHI